MVDSIPLLSHIFLLLCTMATAMVATASTALPPTSPSCSLTRPPLVSCSALVIPRPRCPKIHLVVSIPQEGSRRLGPWSGLKNLGITCRHRKRGGKERYMGRIYASLFGVGAPEVLVIGVVALLVFGPKGLAEVARNLGKTLRAFQPTIRELQEVSREFKSTLEREIGLDEIPPSTNNSTYQSSSFTNEAPPPTVDPNGSPSTSRSFTSDQLLRLTREQLASSQAAAQARETSLEDQPQGAPDALSSPEVSKTLSTSETAGSGSAPEIAATSTSGTASSVSASEVAAQTTLVQNSENEGSKS